MKKMEMIIIVVLVVYNVKLIRTIKLDFSIVICMHTCTCTQLYILFIVLYAMDFDHVSCLCFYFHEACIFVSRWVLCIFCTIFSLKHILCILLVTDVIGVILLREKSLFSVLQKIHVKLMDTINLEIFLILQHYR